MSIIAWIVLGLIAGFIASKIVNKVGQGFWLDIALGIIGAFVGGFIFESIRWNRGHRVQSLQHVSCSYRSHHCARRLPRCDRSPVSIEAFPRLSPPRWTRNHSRSFDHLRRPVAFRTAMATAFF